MRESGMPSIIHVIAQFDEDARVWVASSSDVFGLHVEAATLDSLQEAVVKLLPDLLMDESGSLMPDSEFDVPVQLLANFHCTTKLSA